MWMILGAELTEPRVFAQDRPSLVAVESPEAAEGDSITHQLIGESSISIGFWAAYHDSGQSQRPWVSILPHS